jgi:hypothetical protein
LSNFAQADEGKEKVRKLIEMTKSSGVKLEDPRRRVNHNLRSRRRQPQAENELRRTVDETTKFIRGFGKLNEGEPIDPNYP